MNAGTVPSRNASLARAKLDIVPKPNLPTAVFKNVSHCIEQQPIFRRQQHFLIGLVAANKALRSADPDEAKRVGQQSRVETQHASGLDRR